MGFRATPSLTLYAGERLPGGRRFSSSPGLRQGRSFAGSLKPAAGSPRILISGSKMLYVSVGAFRIEKGWGTTLSSWQNKQIRQKERGDLSSKPCWLACRKGDRLTGYLIFRVRSIARARGEKCPPGSVDPRLPVLTRGCPDDGCGLARLKFTDVAPDRTGLHLHG